MPISPVVDTLDNVEEALQAFYVEHEGKFHLDLDQDALRQHRGVTPLANAYAAEKAKATEASAKARKAAEDLATALKDRPDADEIIKLRQTLEAERDEWRGKAEEASAKLTGVTRDRALADALTAAGVTNPAFVKAATAMLSGSVKMAEAGAVVETDMGPVPVADHVKRWAAGEGKDFVSPPAGGGAKGGTQQPAGAGTMSRADYDALTPDKQRAAVLKGVTLAD